MHILHMRDIVLPARESAVTNDGRRTSASLPLRLEFVASKNFIWLGCYRLMEEKGLLLPLLAKGDLEGLKKAISENPDASAAAIISEMEPSQRRTPLHIAAQNGNVGTKFFSDFYIYSPLHRGSTVNCTFLSIIKIDLTKSQKSSRRCWPFRRMERM